MSSKFTDHLIIRLIHMLCIVGLIACTVWILIDQFHLIGSGFFLAFLLTPAINNLERKGVSRTLASVMILTFSGLWLYVFYLFVEPLFFEQYEYFVRHKLLFHEKTGAVLNQLKTFLDPLVGSEVLSRIEYNLMVSFEAKKEAFENSLPGWIENGVSFLSSFIFVPIVAFYFMSQGYRIKQSFVAMIPNRYFEMTLMIIHQVNSKLGGYLRGQFADCMIIGILAVLGLHVIGVKGAFAIGVFAGLANAIPYVGPVLGAIPAIVVLLIDPYAASPWWVVPIVFLIINFLDNVVVYPMTIGRSLNLHPLLVIIMIFFGGSVAGIIGMIVVVPLTAIIINCIQVLHQSLKSYRII